MSPGLPILYICAIGGFLIVAASFLLLWKRRIFLDRATKKVTEIELPGGLKLKTQAPVIVLILMGGGVMMFSVIQAVKFGEEVTIDGQVRGSATSIELYASVASQSLPQSGAFTFPLPVTHPARKYMLLYAVDGNLIQHQIVDPAVDSGRTLEAVELQMPAAPHLVGEIDPVPPGY
jgi:hypothetical protein